MMSDDKRESSDIPTHVNEGGVPAGEVRPQPPSDAELDERNRAMARPRRAAGPLLEDAGATREAASHEPPAATEPATAERTTSSQGDATHAGDAGRPVNHAGPKPSDDELSRRNRMMAGPRRAAGPPLEDTSHQGAISEVAHEPPPETNPSER
jgi:hypothetical protein